MIGERTVMREAFFYGFSLEQHVPTDHLLRSIERFADLSGMCEHLHRDRAVDRGRLYSDLALVHLKPANILGLRSIRRPPEEHCDPAHKANIIVLKM